MADEEQVGPAEELTQAEAKVQQRHFMVLLVTILSIEVAQVILGPALTESRVVGWLQAIIIAVTIYAVGGKRHLTIAALLLGVPVVVARAVSLSIPRAEAEIITLTLTVVFLAYVIWIIMSAVVRPGEVTVDKIYGAICVYLLLGMLWAHLYGILEIAEPGSFSFPDQTTPVSRVEQGDYRALEHDLGYYSYVTLTTLGYGDITPVTHRARQLSWLEALFGQLYIAITIARLVASQIAHSKQGDD